jgi:septal ring factor EnvC (AmiA/AmiB activator)
MNRARNIAFVILTLVLACPAMADVNEDLRGIRKEIKEKQRLLRKTRKVETEVSRELGQIEKSLHEKEANLAVLGRNLREVEGQIGRTQREIEAAKNEAELKKQQIQVRISALYKAGEIGGARMFFSSGSLPQMVENLRYMRSVVDNDRRLFAEYAARIERLGVLKTSLEHDAQRNEKIKASIELKKRDVEDERKKKATYLVQVRSDTQSYLASLRELEANARRLQAMVEKLEARSRKGYTKSRKPSVGGDPQLPAVPDKGFGALKGRLSMPVKGSIIGNYGRHKHPEYNSYTVSNGISIAATYGSDIRAVYDGQIIFADYFKGYGNMVIVDHGGGFFSLYAHAAKFMKKVGAQVARNEVVASVGDTDSAKGPMLYFEIRYQGKPVDPSSWFR